MNTPNNFPRHGAETPTIGRKIQANGNYTPQFNNEEDFEVELVDQDLAFPAEDIALLLKPIPEKDIEKNAGLDKLVGRRLQEARSSAAELEPYATKSLATILEQTSKEKLSVEQQFVQRAEMMSEGYELALAELHAQYLQARNDDVIMEQFALDNLERIDTVAKRFVSCTQVASSLLEHKINSVEAYQTRHKNVRDGAIETIITLTARHHVLEAEIDTVRQNLKKNKKELFGYDATQAKLVDDIIKLKTDEIEERDALSNPEIDIVHGQFGFHGAGVEEAVEAIRANVSSDELTIILRKLGDLKEEREQNKDNITRCHGKIDANNLMLTAAQAELRSIPDQISEARIILTDELESTVPELRFSSSSVRENTETLSEVVHGNTTDAAKSALPEPFLPVFAARDELKALMETPKFDFVKEYVPPVFELDDSFFVPFKRDLNEESSLSPGIERRQTADTFNQTQDVNIVNIIARGWRKAGRRTEIKKNQISPLES